MANEQEINRKRKNSHDFQIPTSFSDFNEEDKELLTLSLSFRPTRPRQQPPPPPPQTLPPPLLPQQSFFSQQPPPQYPLQLPPSHTIFMPPPPPPPLPPAPMAYRQDAGGPSRPLRVRRNSTQNPREGKSNTVPAPFVWATTHRATVHTLKDLLNNGITIISGKVQCKRCERQYEIEYDLEKKFNEVGRFIVDNKATMHDRAPTVWMNPNLPTCKFCDQENSAKPIVSDKKKSINWLFLLLGQMLGCCTLEQLKYFCKHTKNHRTGAKDRVLYLTYLGLCKQLDPLGPFNR